MNGLFTMVLAGIQYLQARFGREEGSVATEYGLLVVFIALVIIAGVTALGIVLNTVFNNASTSLGGAT